MLLIAKAENCKAAEQLFSQLPNDRTVIGMGNLKDKKDTERHTKRIESDQNP